MFACHVSSIGVLYFQQEVLFLSVEILFCLEEHMPYTVARSTLSILVSRFFLFYFAMRGFGGRLDATMWR